MINRHRHTISTGLLTLWFIALNLALTAQPPAANFYSRIPSVFENSETWSSASHDGNSSGTNPGCVINGNVNIYIEDSLVSSCDPMLVNGNANFIIRNGGHLELRGDIEIYGNAEFDIDASSSLSIIGDLEVAGNGDLILDGSLYVDGDVSVSGNAEACGTGTAEITGIISGDGWCLSIGVLPVELIEFKGKVSDVSDVSISWQTASEINSDAFILERSSNGLIFERITEIAGAGNSNTLNKYNYLDRDLAPGTYYYQLTQLDFSGKTETFDLIAVTIKDQSEEPCELDVMPNPCVPSCKAVLDCPGKVFRTYIMDGYGRMISELIPVSSFNGQSTYHINEDNFLMPGVYIIKAAASDEQLSKKVMIK